MLCEYGRREARNLAPLPGSSRTLTVRQWVAACAAPTWLQVLALAITYYAAAQVGYASEFACPVAAIVWPPVGVAIAFLYLGGLGLWPGVLLGDLLVNDYSALPVGCAVRQTVGNLLEVLVATLLMRRRSRAACRWRAREPRADGAGDRRRSPRSARRSACCRWPRRGDRPGASPDVWRTWWLGDFSGALVFCWSRWSGFAAAAPLAACAPSRRR